MQGVFKNSSIFTAPGLGSDYTELGLYYAYDTGNGKSLQFYVEDGTVMEIDYYYEGA